MENVWNETNQNGEMLQGLLEFEDCNKFWGGGEGERKTWKVREEIESERVWKPHEHVRKYLRH